MSYQKKKESDNSWIWWVVIIAAFLFLSKSCGGGSGQSSPNYPFDTSAQDDADTAAEIREGQQELEQIESDPCLQDIMDGVPPEYQRCGGNQPSNDFDDYDYVEPSNSESVSGCPHGCEYYQTGCDIKGNISLDGEKIYHVPGGEFYSATSINPEYGERWFCSEGEAISNGWRKSFK